MGRRDRPRDRGRVPRERSHDSESYRTQADSLLQFGDLYSKVASIVWFSVTVTFCSIFPYRSCQAVSVYVPAGILSIFHDPSPSLVAAKNGLSKTPMYPVIHGCTSHLTRTNSG